MNTDEIQAVREMQTFTYIIHMETSSFTVLMKEEHHTRALETNTVIAQCDVEQANVRTIRQYVNYCSERLQARLQRRLLCRTRPHEA